MSVEQLKTIEFLDQLKQQGVLTHEEYTQIRLRYLTLTPSGQLGAMEPRRQKKLTMFMLIIVFLLLTLGLGIAFDLIPQGKQSLQLLKRLTPETSDFNPGLVQTPKMILLKNRNAFDYEGCELEINKRFIARVPHVKPKETVMIPYLTILDEDGNLYDPTLMPIMDAEFSCINYNGRPELISLTQK